MRRSSCSAPLANELIGHSRHRRSNGLSSWTATSGSGSRRSPGDIARDEAGDCRCFPTVAWSHRWCSPSRRPVGCRHPRLFPSQRPPSPHGPPPSPRRHPRPRPSRSLPCPRRHRQYEYKTEWIWLSSTFDDQMEELARAVTEKYRAPLDIPATVSVTAEQWLAQGQPLMVSGPASGARRAQRHGRPE